MDKESINEHIRNGLSPLQCLVDTLRIYKDTTQSNRETMLDFALEHLDNCQKSINRLCLLGTKSYEEDENLWRNSYYCDIPC